MVSNDVVMQTVKRMISSGVDDGTIRMTLKGIGLSDAEIDSVLSQAKGIRQDVSPAENAAGEDEEAAGSGEEYNDEAVDEADEDSGEDESGLKDEIHASSEEQSAAHAATQGMLDEHGQQLGEISRNISGLHEKVDSAPALSPETIGKINALDSRISSLERLVSETKGNTEALKELLQKILETNRKALLELERKK